MKLIYKILFITGIISLLLISCNDDEFGPRKESTPQFESAAVNPTSFTFGDSITLTAKITDPATTLTILAYEVVSGNKVITQGEIPIGGDSHEVSHAIFVPLLSNQADNSEVQVNLVAHNILKGFTTTQVTSLTGKRPVYPQLYLITDIGEIAILEPLANDKNQYYTGELPFDTSFGFKIAEKVKDDNSIDYTGDVYGNVDGRIGMISESGESSFVYTQSGDYTKELTFDSYSLSVTTIGENLGEEELGLSIFTDQSINGESFKVLQFHLENGKTYPVFGELAETKNLFNPDFFERIAADKVTFLGETGKYTIYYNTVRKNTFVGVDNPSYPDYLLVCGWGLGYPTNITSEKIASIYLGKGRTHTDWGFDHVMKYVLMRQIGEGIYQGTFYTPGDHDRYASFKPFENTGWGNEKQAGGFTFTGDQIISGDNNWDIPNGENDPVIEPANYRFTINLNNNTVHIEKVIL